MFINELKTYIDYLKNKIEETKVSSTKKQEQYLVTFINNLKEGTNYYYNLFSNLKGIVDETKENILTSLKSNNIIIDRLHVEIEKLSMKKL